MWGGDMINSPGGIPSVGAKRRSEEPRTRIALALTAPQKDAVKGFVQTIAAMEMLRQVKVRDTLGIVVDVGDNPDVLGVVVGKDAALARISDLLDSARTHLQAGGAAFPFTLTS